MFSGSDRLIIVLTPEYLSVARMHNSKVRRAERVELDAGKWDESWNGGLHAYDQALRQVLARLGGTGKKWDAELFYTSPGSVSRVEITSQDQITSVAAMINGLKQSVGRANPAQAIGLYTKDQTTLVLGASDTDVNLQKLYGWLNRSKVTAHRIIPQTASVVRQSFLHAQNAVEDTVVLYISARSSVIAYCKDREPKLVRLIELGFDSIADVYRRSLAQEQSEAHKPSNASGHTAPSTVQESDSQTAEELLFKHGIPISKSSEPGMYAKLMPAMSPVLQRICIEVKQTLRFASSIDRSPSNLLICGPGAAIPSIAKALGQSLDLHVMADPDASGYSPAEIFGVGTDEWVVAHDDTPELKLLPRAAIEMRTQKTLARTLKIGAFLAAAVLGAQYLYSYQTVNSMSNSIDEKAAVIGRIESDQIRRHEIRAMAGSIGAAATLLQDSVGKKADWTSVLGFMPDADREIIQITEIQGLINAGKPIINLTGTAMADTDGTDPSKVLASYIRSLKDIPAVKGVEIGSTSRANIDASTWGLRFVLNIEMHTVEGEFSELVTLGADYEGDYE